MQEIDYRLTATQSVEWLYGRLLKANPESPITPNPNPNPKLVLKRSFNSSLLSNIEPQSSQSTTNSQTSKQIRLKRCKHNARTVSTTGPENCKNLPLDFSSHLEMVCKHACWWKKKRRLDLNAGKLGVFDRCYVPLTHATTSVFMPMHVSNFSSMLERRHASELIHNRDCIFC